MNLKEFIASGPVLTDGAWGTELQKLGLTPGECPDYWSILHPDRVRQVAESYVQAGSRVILTWTFQANRVALAEHGLEARAAEMNAAGVRISRQAAAGKALVFASMGPTGKLLSAEEIEPGAIAEAYAEQAQALAEAGADALLFETMSDIGEASIGLAEAKKTGLPVVVSFTFENGKNRDRTMTGVTPEAAARRMTEEGADAIGANCGVGIAEYVAICRRLRAATTLPVWIKANAGLPEMIEGRTEYRTGPAQFASHIPALIREGANFVGGCCGTSPEFIRAAAGALAEACA